jgi:hypothetical protein
VIALAEIGSGSNFVMLVVRVADVTGELSVIIMGMCF